MSSTTILGRVGLVPDGEYNNERTYKRLYFVAYEGSSYVCLKDDIQGVPPTPENVVPAEGAVWQPLAEKGARGEDGERGADGVPGKDGAPGEPGKDGKAYVILGPVYPTEDALRQAVTSPNEGDRYEVGDAPPYDVCRWTGTDWVNEGPLTGGSGGGGAELSDDIPMPLGEASPGASDKAARADHVHEMPSAQEVGARPDTWTPTAKEVGARPDDWIPTLEEIGGTWKAGDVLTIDNSTVISSGATNKTSLYLGIPLGRPVTASTVRIEVLKIVTNANGSSIIANIDVLANAQYTVRTHALEKNIGILTIQIQRADDSKTAEFPVRDSTYVYINELRAVFE